MVPQGRQGSDYTADSQYQAETTSPRPCPSTTFSSIMVSLRDMGDYSYDEADRLTSVTSPGPKTVGYRYDADGNRVKVIYPDSTAVTYAFDKGSRLESLLDWGSRTAGYQYHPDGSIKQVTSFNGTSAAYSSPENVRYVVVRRLLAA